MGNKTYIDKFSSGLYWNFNETQDAIDIETKNVVYYYSVIAPSYWIICHFIEMASKQTPGDKATIIIMHVYLRGLYCN